jgi:hypothetical protein
MNRWALAIILGYVSVFGVPRSVQPVAPVPSISTPSSTLRAAVQPVVDVMRGASPADRALLADLFVKTGGVVVADKDGEQLFADTRSLREYVRIASTIGWSRLGGNAAGKYSGLGAAIEKAFVETMGLESKAVDAAGRQKFGDLCEAVGWAALQR